jgi:hypothetical protein
MTGWSAAAQIIVVHRRQVIVNEAVNMDQLNRGGGGIEVSQRGAQ